MRQFKAGPHITTGPAGINELRSLPVRRLLIAFLSERPDDVRTDFNKKPAISLPLAVAPFMLDEGHSSLDTLGRSGSLARQFDQAERSEAALANSPTLSDRPHVAVKGNQYCVVCLRGSAYERIWRTGCNSFA